jgi:hypothetical protein
MKIDTDVSWQQPLFSKFPRVFKNLNYLECEKGWLSIINSLCSIIENHIEHTIPEEIKDEIFAIQIKEKFGGLRFYMSTTTPYIDGAISLAEAVSYSQCEYCGQASNRGLPQKGWIKTFCDACYKKYKG